MPYHSNSSVNSNSLFSQSFYEPDKNKENNKDNNNINKNGEHLNEKKSSISHYIFNEDYRIKDDIESYSNLNDYEMNKEKNINENINENNNNYNVNIKKENDNNKFHCLRCSNSNSHKNFLNEELSQNSSQNINNNEKLTVALLGKKK